MRDYPGMSFDCSNGLEEEDAGSRLRLLVWCGYFWLLLTWTTSEALLGVVFLVS